MEELHLHVDSLSQALLVLDQRTFVPQCPSKRIKKNSRTLLWSALFFQNFQSWNMSKHAKTIQNIKTCINVLLKSVYSSLSQQASLQKKNVQLAGARFKSLSTLSERCPIESSWHQLMPSEIFWDSYPRHVEKIKCLCPCFIQATSFKRVGALLIRGGKCCEVEVSNCEWCWILMQSPETIVLIDLVLPSSLCDWLAGAFGI